MVDTLSPLLRSSITLMTTELSGFSFKKSLIIVCGTSPSPPTTSIPF